MLDEETNDISYDDRTMMVNSGELDLEGRPRRASLIVLAGWEIGRKIELTGTEHLFGRSMDADTRIASQSVSREHAKIVRVEEKDGHHFLITDLDSSNGTRVNNLPVTSTRLRDGDKVLMGDVLFKFVLGDEEDSKFYHNVHRLIHYDQLTGLMTMEAFRRQLDTEIQRSLPGGRFCLAMTDLDGLKRVNDTYGHLAGRMVVREMGAMIRQALRPNDIAALYGGDETIILFPDTSLEAAKEVAERLREAIEARVFEHDGNTFRVTISQGLAEWPVHGRTMEQIVAVADQALYTAKAAGRNCVRVAVV